MHILIFRFFKNLTIFSHKHYFKLLNATFLDTTRRDLFNNVKNFTLKAKGPEELSLPKIFFFCNYLALTSIFNIKVYFRDNC
jgi:hypothetical protein